MGGVTVKKLALLCSLAAVPLLLWAAWDLWRYDGSQYPILPAVAAALALGLLVLGALLRRKAGPPRVRRAVTGLLVLTMAASWAVGFFCTASVDAEYAAGRYLETYGDLADTLARWNLSRLGNAEFNASYENYDKSQLWMTVEEGSRANIALFGGSYAGGQSGFLSRGPGGQTWSAAALYDAAGNLLACSWEDFFWFRYFTEAQWEAREDVSRSYARATFDRSKLTEAGRELVLDGDMIFDAEALRLTGTFDGETLLPQSIACVTWDDFYSALGPGTHRISAVIQDKDLPWTVLYEDPAAPAGETVTLYADDFRVCCGTASPAFSYAGQDYENLAGLVEALGPQWLAGEPLERRYEGLALIIPDSYWLTDEAGEPVIQAVYAVYASPWRTAWRELGGIAWKTLLLGAVLCLIVRAILRRNLIGPVEEASAMVEADRTVQLLPKTWRETQVLREGVHAWETTLGKQKNELARLGKALDYAKEAEANRRQMTSNIAHELKTPLAVIHSYAEGLKARVAEEKREKYLDVILAEAERTDAMVMELLDLSRLEAGKVKLSRDEFSLTDLTRAIFEKLEPAAEARGLRIDFRLPAACTVVADESRLAQVVENFASNAVKYTPQEGRIAVEIRRERGRTWFTVENDSPPLSDEALAHVWDAFYRADEARSGPGTGLGLAIAHQIIALHGGACTARNTATGVAFGFSLS